MTHRDTNAVDKLPTFAYCQVINFILIYFNVVKIRYPIQLLAIMFINLQLVFYFLDF